MKIGIIIPDRSDRPDLLKNCLQMIQRQTLKVEYFQLMNYEPLDSSCDITQRYRTGYELLGLISDIDLIAFIENDDWYAPDYLEYMVGEWEKAGRPDLFGTNYTIYYHLKLKKYFTMRHNSRASAMNTLIKPKLKFQWCADNEPYTDLHLWTKEHGFTKHVIEPNHIISVGMKHGTGLCGGRSHVDRLHRFINADNGFLKNTLDSESFEFYNNLYKSE